MRERPDRVRWCSAAKDDLRLGASALLWPVSCRKLTRSVLQKLDVADTGLEASLVLVDFAPNVAAGRHTHPVAVSAYVVYGSIEVEIEGGARRLFAAGESFTVPANTVHDERTGAAGARIVASLVVPAGAPLATPAN